MFIEAGERDVTVSWENLKEGDSIFSKRRILSENTR
jgi:hypothetical protein